jgi:hypothetical protein
VLRLATDEAGRDRVRAAVAQSLDMWWLFFDGISGAL